MNVEYKKNLTLQKSAEKNWLDTIITENTYHRNNKTSRQAINRSQDQLRNQQNASPRQPGPRSSCVGRRRPTTWTKTELWVEDLRQPGPRPSCVGRRPTPFYGKVDSNEEPNSACILSSYDTCFTLH